MGDDDSTDTGRPLNGARLADLERLFQLKQAGALTEAEFEIQKARLMAQPAISRTTRWLLPYGAALLAATAIGGVLAWNFSPAEEDQAPLDLQNQTMMGSLPQDLELVSPPSPPGIRALPVAEQLARAFETAFGRRGSATITRDNGASYGTTNFRETARYRPSRLIWQGDTAILLSEGIVRDAPHVSSGKIAAHYLRPVGDGFEIVAAHLNAVVTGNWGQMSGWTISDRYTSNPVILAEGGGTWQGTTISCTTMVELTAQGPREIGTQLRSYSNGGGLIGDEGEVSVAGRVANITQGREFTVRYSGTSNVSRRYVMQGNQFVRQETPVVEGVCDDQAD